MHSALTIDDVTAVLAEVERFAARVIAPAVERPEHAIGASDLAAITREAEEAGLLSPVGEAAVGLWDEPETPEGRGLSVHTLERIAEVNAGVAFHFHQVALARWGCRRLELEAHDVALSLQGSYGLCGRALARCLADETLDETDRHALSDYFSPGDGGALVLHAAEGWQRLLAPGFDSAQGFLWQTVERSTLELTTEAPSHGLDELGTWTVRLGTPGTTVACGEQATHLYGEALMLDGLALMSIALGALRHARRMASDYAGVRRQGGVLIGAHDAVRSLLARGATTMHDVGLMLGALAREKISPAELGRACSVRAGVHPRICDAANDALQVFGGLGYMQDTGLEKIVRDVNHLRRLRGTPTELGLFAAQWEAGP